MTDYKQAIDKILVTEGLYSKDPIDFGGETYRGISRKYFPDWVGWKIIDESKNLGLPDYGVITVNKELKELVYQFYKQNFWNRFMGDEISSQQIAEELMDIAVNLGVHRASLFLQKTLNHLNANQNRWRDIQEDSAIGNVTLETLKQAIAHKSIGERKICIALNTLQGRHYINRVEEDRTQEKFYSGWLERTIYKNG